MSTSGFSADTLRRFGADPSQTAQLQLSVLVEAAKRFVAKPIADKIVEMLEARDRGELKRTADHFISGLVAAYGLLVEIDDAEEALRDATRVAEVNLAPVHPGETPEPELPLSWHASFPRRV